MYQQASLLETARVNMRKFSTAITITDPLIKYRSLVATGIYSPDPAQHRLAKHLQSIYQRIKDYSPRDEYRHRLKEITRLTETPSTSEQAGNDSILALKHHAIWRNPLFKHLWATQEGKDSLALTRVLTDHQRAIEIDSPKGLFLSGEVGTGKSMLLDLLADGLPTERKRRWHFNTFILYVVSQLEHHRRAGPSTMATDSDYSLLWMAKKLVQESPILFLDEFQFPDRAASKLLSHLFIAFFQLGGVLVASSNRMPEELQNATGVDYTPKPSGGLVQKVLGNLARGKGELFGGTSDFAAFLEVLKARCDLWQMDGTKDWRRSEEPGVTSDVMLKTTESLAVEAEVTETSQIHEGTGLPKHYMLLRDSDTIWNRLVQEAASWVNLAPIPWMPSSVVVYGRQVVTPRHHKGFVYWDFHDLVGHFGPADYITMASNYHTFIVDKVPILTMLQKNEARRFITLLDALYEARCKLLIRAANPPDHLFFPTRTSGQQKTKTGEGNHEDAIYAETIAEVFQDQTSPFRPNVSFYDTSSPTSKYDPDQDSDFGLQKKGPDFGNTSAFTGEDERFAYKRAASRLWEMCSERWHARTGDWWKPLPAEARHWEGGEPSKRLEERLLHEKIDAGEGIGPSVEVEEAGLSRWRIEDLKKKEA